LALRSILAAALLGMLFVTEASADVFVPADPQPLRSAWCFAGAGDVVAAGTGPDTG
jgi:hypothetical protein